LIVVGGHGGRVDHWLGNVSIWAAPQYESMAVEIRSGDSRLFVVRDRVELAGEAGAYVSLVPWNGPAEGVSTSGLRWALQGARVAHDRAARGAGRRRQRSMGRRPARPSRTDGALEAPAHDPNRARGSAPLPLRAGGTGRTRALGVGPRCHRRRDG